MSVGIQTLNQLFNKKINKQSFSWQQKLTPAEYRICKLKGTEPPYSGAFLNFFETGTYYCTLCGQALFTSEHKYQAPYGWPSFYDVVSNATITKLDFKNGKIRTQISCSKCKSHLGFVFNGGPAPTYKRYSINSIALNFKQNIRL